MAAREPPSDGEGDVAEAIPVAAGKRPLVREGQPGRRVLGGRWHFRLDNEDEGFAGVTCGSARCAGWRPISVPHDWNGAERGSTARRWAGTGATSRSPAQRAARAGSSVRRRRARLDRLPQRAGDRPPQRQLPALRGGPARPAARRQPAGGAGLVASHGGRPHALARGALSTVSATAAGGTSAGSTARSRCARRGASTSAAPRRCRGWRAPTCPARVQVRALVRNLRRARGPAARSSPERRADGAATRRVISRPAPRRELVGRDHDREAPAVGHRPRQPLPASTFRRGRRRASAAYRTWFGIRDVRKLPTDGCC